MEQSRYRTYASVDLSAIRHNFNTVRSLLRPSCKIMSVIKADGYGHGALPVARCLWDSDYFGVACRDEATALREQGITTPILILGYTDPREAPLLSEAGITQCVFSEEYALALQESLQDGQTLKVHLKIDTGMSRLGFYLHGPDEIEATAQKISDLIQKTPNLRYEGIFTHFTTSETEKSPETEEQFSLFCGLLDHLNAQGVTFALRHCANSGATLLHPETHLDMVRPGIALYGYTPFPEGERFGLRPALELKAYVAQVHHIRKGDTVSYNRTFRAEKDMDAATVCIGYGDGLHRVLSNGSPVLVNGQRTRILGRICMDQCIVDVTGIPTETGDVVTLLGRDGDRTITAWEMADHAQTIHYEILCSIGKRIPKIYPPSAEEPKHENRN